MVQDVFLPCWNVILCQGYAPAGPVAVDWDRDGELDLILARAGGKAIQNAEHEWIGLGKIQCMCLFT